MAEKQKDPRESRKLRKSTLEKSTDSLIERQNEFWASGEAGASRPLYKDNDTPHTTQEFPREKGKYRI